MIRINISDGETFKFDLDNELQAKRLVGLLRDRDFQQSITAITALRQYRRKQRCPNKKCHSIANVVCPECGAINSQNDVQYTGNQYTLVRPAEFNKVSFGVEYIQSNIEGGGKGIEKLYCNAGAVQLVVASYGNQPSARLTLREIGDQIYNPNIG